MLKFSNSFCRCILRACDRVDFTTHVREFVYLNCKGKKCGTQCSTGEQALHTGTLLRKKRIKIPTFKLNASKRAVPMSDLQPNANHVSCGGKFHVSPTDTESLEDWRKRSPPESKVVEDWRKRSPPESKFVEDWKKRPDDSSSKDEEHNLKPCIVPPDFRVWETVSGSGTSSDSNTFRFKVMSYNVLAQYLLECHPYLYTACTPRNLKWKVRAARLFDEIINLSPDILCLQEVQSSHINSFYSKFEELGYFGIFKQKTGHRQDGCAIYFKQALFKMEDHVSVEFYQPDLPILNRDNIGIMVKLAPCSRPGSPIVVATTHLLYNPKRTDVRLAQIQVFLAEIDRFAYNTTDKEFGHLPIILTGDFNSMPESAVIKLLDRGHVSASPFRDSSDWQRIGVTDNCQHLSVCLNRREGRSTDYSYIKLYNSEYCTSSPHSNCEVKEELPPGDFSELFNSGVIRHSLQLTSVYDKYKADGAEEASTFQDYWVTVDYIYFSYGSKMALYDTKEGFLKNVGIFYDQGGNAPDTLSETFFCNSALRLVERLRLPTVSECQVLGRLPNDVYGSDHLALAATFEIKPYKSAL